jgi:hypothetical protein
VLVSGWQQALTLVAVLIPGFVFQGVRRNRIGPSPEDRELAARLVRALAVSVGFSLVYLLCLGDKLTNSLAEPRMARCRIKSDTAASAWVRSLRLWGSPALRVLR